MEVEAYAETTAGAVMSPANQPINEMSPFARHASTGEVAAWQLGLDSAADCLEPSEAAGQLGGSAPMRLGRKRRDKPGSSRVPGSVRHDRQVFRYRGRYPLGRERWRRDDAISRFKKASPWDAASED
jgi:hypothetical protein